VILRQSKTKVTSIAAGIGTRYRALDSDMAGLTPEVIRPILPLTRSLSRIRLRYASQVRQVAGSQIDPAAGAILRHRRIGVPLSERDITKLWKYTTSSFRDHIARSGDRPFEPRN
jgi:hypothetical protein